MLLIINIYNQAATEMWLLFIMVKRKTLSAAKAESVFCHSSINSNRSLISHSSALHKAPNVSR